MEHPLARDFDDPERYEREKITRIMPDNLMRLGVYTLRMMWPEDLRPPYATEFLTCVIDVNRRDDDYYEVGFMIQAAEAPEPSDGVFNPEGFMVVAGDDSLEIGADPSTETEMAYFLGSTHPLDLELAELVAKAQILTV